MSRILFDQNVPRALRAYLTGYAVRTAAEEGWSELINGNLLLAAEAAGFAVMITADQSIVYQQNMAGRRIAFLVLSTNQWPTLQGRVGDILRALKQAEVSSFTFVDCDARLSAARPDSV